MTDPTDRRQHPRLRSTARILWSVVGTSELQYDRLRDVSASGALVATESLPRAGEEIRFDLLDDAGERLATGLAKVAWTRPGKGMGITFVALGIDTALLATLTATADDAFPRRPPPLPGKKGGPPPMPVVPSIRPAADEADVVSDDDDEIAPEIEPLAVRSAGVVIGIDLGTTNTCASYVVDGKPRIIPGRTGTNTIPSMITFDKDGSWHVGQRAADRQVLQPTRTVYGSKRLVGRTYRADLADELQRFFAYPLGEAEGQRFGVRIDDRVVSMETIAARVLDEVRKTAEEHLGERVEAAVITVPAYFSEVQREAVRRAAREANLVVHRILNEPTAAAVAYGHKQGQKRARIAVWDFGGGTFDFSLVDVTDGKIEVVATAGDNFVGGSDLDDRLAAHLLAEFQRKENLDLDPTPQQIARLREAAEAAKRSLSVQTEHLVELPELTSEPKRALAVELTRAHFDELARPLVERTVAIATQVLAERGIAPKEIDEVVLVGGTTRVPAVQRAVEKLFGKKPSKRINPDEAVALGAALVASDTGTAPALLDVLPMSVGRGVAGGRFEPIAPRNTRLPAQHEVTLPADLLGSVTVPIFQGESPDLKDDEYLCSILVEDPTLRDGGRVVIRISFDEHCVMAIEARDARTGRALATTLDRARPAAEVLRELGAFQGPPPALPRRQESGLAKVFGRLAKLLGR